MNQIKLNRISLNKRQKIHKTYSIWWEKKKNKRILKKKKCKQIHICKVVGRWRE